MHDRHPLIGSDLAVRGVRLHVVDRGGKKAKSKTAQRTLLFLHGLPTTGYLWHDVVRDLESSFRCIVPDLVGCGDSESPQDSAAYGPGQQAQTMLALLDHLGVRAATVVGHDIGGTIAVQMAGLQPERVEALALLTPNLHGENWPVRSALPFTLPVVGEASMFGLQHVPGLGELILKRALDPTMPSEEARQYLAPIRTATGAAGLLRVFRAFDPAGAEAILPSLGDIPTLLLWGEKDAIHPVAQGKMCADDIPGARWVPISGGGHLLPTRAPQRVAEELAAFVEETGLDAAVPIESGDLEVE